MYIYTPVGRDEGVLQVGLIDSSYNLQGLMACSVVANIQSCLHKSPDDLYFVMGFACRIACWWVALYPVAANKLRQSLGSMGAEACEPSEARQVLI